MAVIVIVYPFWTMAGVEHGRNIETFFEDVGLAAAFLIRAWPLAFPKRPKATLKYLYFEQLCCIARPYSLNPADRRKWSS